METPKILERPVAPGAAQHERVLREGGVLGAAVLRQESGVEAQPAAVASSVRVVGPTETPAQGCVPLRPRCVRTVAQLGGGAAATVVGDPERCGPGRWQDQRAEALQPRHVPI